jgi:hypothetical protein
MSKIDPQVLAHLEWLGYVRPTGLVVSAPALVRSGAILDQRDVEGQRLVRACLVPGEELRIGDFRTFATTVLGWRFSPRAYAGTDECPIPPELEVPLEDTGEVLRPNFAVREPEPENGSSDWQLLVHALGPEESFDLESPGGFALSPQSSMERLLRKTGVTAGLLVNASALRVISAPRGESSGWLDFRVADMAQTAGRPISSALRLLLSERRLLSLPRHQRLAALLAGSRKFQNEVSEKLAAQVLHAMYELLRGFQAANDASKGVLLREPLGEQPDDVYRALLTVILRLVFLLYAEERDMLPGDDAFLRYYSIAGLYQRLREDAALFLDTMGQRYGAWSQLISLFRMVHDGAKAEHLNLPARHGALFDPDRFKFLEGRTGSGGRQTHERIKPPLVPDGTIFRALEKLLVLDGERISYRALDVEQIGSVYETMMGFRLETATGRSVAIKSQKNHGAPTVLDLEELLALPPANRAKSVLDQTGRKLTDAVKKNMAAADTLVELHAALSPVIDHAATPDLVPRGAMVLQPSEERRRSGSHYTPRELTEPIVRTTLDPILARLSGADGIAPRPERILDLKVCDPAMGSGAFLVEACRYLGDALIEAWHAHNAPPELPADEDEVVFARRLIAQRCLYGVDRNPIAVDLAKMSLWLVTLAKDHALTFVDHALRHGDSLVGLSRRQLEAFHWDASKPPFLHGLGIRDSLDQAADLRLRIREADESISDWQRRDMWDEAEAELARVRLIGDLAVVAFFDGATARQRETKRYEFANAVLKGEAAQYRERVRELRESDPPLAPFHWEIEFPEVFERKPPGFDAFVGNPPFAGKNAVIAGNVSRYGEWLKELHAESHGNADLVAHFFRRAFDLLGKDGTLGLIATNTISQGDTRSTGLRWISAHGGQIFAVTRRVKWPGMAAVVVSVVHIIKGEFPGTKRLDRASVTRISAFLFHRGSDDDPIRLAANAEKSFQGSIVLGMGFTFDDTDVKGVATSIGEMRRLIERDPRNEDVIFPYIGGEEVNDNPRHLHHRYVINFHDRALDEARKWPDLVQIVRARVKPERDRQNRKALRERWWQYAEKRPGLVAAIRQLDRVLVINCGATPHMSFAFLPSRFVFANTLVVLPFTSYAAFCTLQARPHEVWARFFGSSMKDDLRYTPSDCFETFPFRENWVSHAALEDAGKTYYEFRAALMIQKNEGMTKTYNRFHDPEERDPDIHKLRELHAAMDRAVLNAYRWEDIDTRCQFLLDYEIDEEEWGEKKKPWRYRWPDEVRDEVLARLLELNAERAQAEGRSGSGTQKKGRRKVSLTVADQGDSFL